MSILYRTHKSLPPSAKVSSLYIFDALCRAARHQAQKQGIVGDINSPTGNCATFLLKVEGVLEGLFQDMVAIGTSESKVRYITQVFVQGWLLSGGVRYLLTLPITPCLKCYNGGDFTSTGSPSRESHLHHCISDRDSTYHHMITDFLNRMIALILTCYDPSSNHRKRPRRFLTYG